MVKKTALIVSILSLIGAVFAYDKYISIMSPNVPEKLDNSIVYVPTNTSFSDLVEILYSSFAGAK